MLFQTIQGNKNSFICVIYFTLTLNYQESKGCLQKKNIAQKVTLEHTGGRGQNLFVTCPIRVGWWISEVCADQVILKHLYIETTVQKDFSQKSIFSREITFEKWPKNEKLWFSRKQANILKSFRSWTPNIFHF